jgi:serpin B
MERRLLLALFITIGTLAACAVDGTSGGSPSTEPNSADPVALGVLPPSAGVERASESADAPVVELSAGLNNAGFDLWRTQDNDANLVFSPASIGHALLMARAAADDPTGAAIDQAFGLPEGASAHEAWNTIDAGIAASQSDQVTVAIADRIWPRLDIQPDQDWIDLLVRHHGADVQPLDFNGDPNGSREIINEWVSNRTQELIPNLLPEGFIRPGQTVLVLTDALYFEAKWETMFGKYGPVEGTFTNLDGSTVPVEFMQELELSDLRGAGDGFVGAEIPYAGNEYSMLVIVPDEGRFSEIREQLSQDVLDEIDDTFTSGPFELLLPKWESEATIDLINWLTELGAAPGLYPAIGPNIFLDAAVHAADIAVDENGTVAAAATALGFAESGPPEPELTVAADKPFLYLIRHRSSGLVLFAGQVTSLP